MLVQRNKHFPQPLLSQRENNPTFSRPHPPNLFPSLQRKTSFVSLYNPQMYTDTTIFPSLSGLEMLFSGVCWYFPVVFTNSTCTSEVSKLLAASVFFGRYLQHSGIGGGKSTFLAILRRGRGTALVTFRPDKKN